MTRTFARCCGWAAAASLVVIVSACGEDELEKAVRQDVESRGACAKPIDLTSGLAKELADMEVLICKTTNHNECTPHQDFANALRVSEKPRIF